jgi:hypothetical protein
MLEGRGLPSPAIHTLCQFLVFTASSPCVAVIRDIVSPTFSSTPLLHFHCTFLTYLNASPKKPTMFSPSRETNTAELKSLIAADLAASNELADRISQLRIDIAEGKPLPSKKVDLMERSNKDMTKDLVSRVEEIESAPDLDSTDREMLQALNARLAVCDLQAMRLAELRGVEVSARSTMKKEALEVEGKAGGGVEEDVAEENAAQVDDADEHAARVEDEDQETGENESDSTSASATHSEYSDEPEIDKSNWPLLYQIMDVDPEVLDRDIEPLLNKYVTHLPLQFYSTLTYYRSYKRLALKHSPQFLPKDPDAPVRWEKITKAHEILLNPASRQYYDAHGNTPSGLEDFDIAVLEERSDRSRVAGY